MQKNINIYVVFTIILSFMCQNALSIDENESSDYGHKKQILTTEDPFLNNFYNIKKEKTEISKEITEREKEILTLKENGYTFKESEYIKAIQKGDKMNIMRFISLGMPVDVLPTHENSTLFYAMRYNQKETFKFLQSQGAEVNFVNNRSQNLLLQAIELGFDDMIPFLINESGISLKFVDQNGWNAIHYAIEQKNIGTIFLLINKVPELLAYKNKYKNTPLLLALDKAYKKKDKELIALSKMLIKKERFIDTYNALGNTALHLAVMLDNYTLVKQILEKGANPNINNLKGWKPIDIAIKNKNVQIANLLRYYNSEL